MLEIKVKKKLDCFTIEAEFTCLPGQMQVMVGPSGGGKTTIIRMLAGLENPDEGLIVFNGETWFDSSRGICLPPQKRRLGYVFQEYTLFPHLTLFQNAAFSALDRKEAEDLLKLFAIDHLRDRKPGKVSGGERQRCAICQALARRPQMLLLDEPFSALDVITRRSLREELKAVKQKLLFPIVYATHEITEALYLADEIIPIVEGKVDKNWLQQTITAARSGDASSDSRETLKGVRRPRLALVY